MTKVNYDFYNSGVNTIRSTIIDLTKSLDTNYYNDFFVEDVKGLISDNNIDIKELVYILAFDTKIIDTDNIKQLKDIYVEVLSQFIENNKDKFIMARIGYDDSEKDQMKRNMDKKLFVEKYVALNEVGFVSVDSLTGLEFSQTFVYRNEVSKKFLETVARFEATCFIED
jgi:hypothetical protein